MTSREIVLRAIERRDPPRVPVNYCNRDFDYSDTWPSGCGPAKGFVPSEPGMTEWGFAWQSLDRTMGQPKNTPLADDAAISRFRPPDPADPGRLAHLEGELAAHGDKFIKFGMGISGFNLATFLRGFDTLLTDLHLAPARAGRVLDMVFDFENGVIERLAPWAVGAVAFADDWGTQQGLMVSPAMWRRDFAPRYRRQFDLIHRAGKKVWYHTCGNVWEIIGDLIDAGVDVLELLQPELFGVERLGRQFGGKVCFCCSVDHQRIAISGSRREIFDYARRLRDSLGGFGGGFIGYVEDYASLGMSEQNYQWIREAFHGL